MPGSLAVATKTGHVLLLAYGRDTRLVSQYGPDPMAPEPAPGPRRTGVLLGVVTGLILLALVALLIARQVGGGGHPVAAPSPSPSASPSPEPASPTPLAPLALPDYSGQDFITVRQQLRDLQLGVTLIFNAQGTGQAVDHTVPAAGAAVDRGITVKVYVSGPAPLLVPPNVVGQPCNEGGRLIAAAGLSPRYPAGRTGAVTAQDPPAGSDGVHWNDQTRLTCDPTVSPGPTDSATP
jgi:hypothetical protein